mgnify:CR=1 FL=1
MIIFILSLVAFICIVILLISLLEIFYPSDTLTQSMFIIIDIFIVVILYLDYKLIMLLKAIETVIK